MSYENKQRPFDAVCRAMPRGLLMISEDDKDEIQIYARFHIDPAESKARLGRVFADGIRYHAKTYRYKESMSKLSDTIADLHDKYSGALAKAEPLRGGDLQGMHHELATAGYNAYSALFGLDDNERMFRPGNVSSATREIGELLRDCLARESSLEIVAPLHLVPWPLLYPEKPKSGAPIEVNKFWGYSKVLAVLPLGVASFSDIDETWRSAAAVDPALAEKPGLGELLTGSRLFPSASPNVRPEKHVREASSPEELFQRLRAAGAPHEDFLCFIGHGSGSSRGFEFGQLWFEGGPRFSTDDFRSLFRGRGRVDLSGKPILVFLNGCSTDRGPVTETGMSFPAVLLNDFPGHFYCVATLGPVPPLPAVRFAHAFFRRFLTAGGDGTYPTFGESMRDARLQLLEQHKSPAGLLYIAYGCADMGIGGAAEATRTR